MMPAKLTNIVLAFALMLLVIGDSSAYRRADNKATIAGIAVLAFVLGAVSASYVPTKKVR